MYLEKQPTTKKSKLEKMGWLVQQHTNGEEVTLNNKLQVNSVEFATSLLNHGFYIGEGELAPSSDELDSSWSDFKRTWRHLPTDTYMKDNGNYRQRRYSTMYYSAKLQQLVRKPYVPLYKSSLYNSFAGDLFRYFEMTEASLYSNSHFKRALTLALNTFNRCEALRGNAMPQWFIELDQYRVVAGENTLGKPSPEGTHSDGTSYFLLMLVERHNIQGGVSSVYDQKRHLVGQTTLKNPGDIMLIDDASVLHDVSDLSSSAEGGHRDILHISFTNLNAKKAIQRRFGLSDQEQQLLSSGEVDIQWI